MNRYTALGMINDAAAGSSVLYVGAMEREGHDAFHEVCHFLDTLPAAVGAKVRRTNGRERVSFSSTGGQILFMSIRSALAGRVRRTRLDAVVVPLWDRLEVAQKEGLIEELALCAATRERGLELIRP